MYYSTQYPQVKIAATAAIDGGSGNRSINNLFNWSHSAQLYNKTKLQNLFSDQECYNSKQYLQYIEHESNEQTSRKI